MVIEQMQIVPSRPGDPSLEEVLEDYRRRHALPEEVVLGTLMEALSMRRVQAWVALRGDQPMGGVVFSHKEGHGRIHLLHALPRAESAIPALLSRAEAELLGQEGLTQISATLALLPDDILERVFRERGYRVFSRARLRLDLAGFAGEFGLPFGYQLVPWRDDRREEAAVLMEVAHRETEDAALYPELASLEGARRLLEQALVGKMGTFDPICSPMVLQGNLLAGLCLAAWHLVLSQQGFIIDLAVESAHRRRGLGRALVVATAQAFQQAGAATLGLAVTMSNHPALHLYESLGFYIEQRFSVFRQQV